MGKDAMKIDRIKEMKERLVECLGGEIDRGLEHLDTEEAYKVADIIKDLAETEKLCYEAKYYETVIEAMEDGEDEMSEEKYGYRRSRDSMGRYTSRRGGRRGYRPYVDQEPYINEYLNNPDFAENMRMGYSDGGNRGGNTGGMASGRSGYDMQDSRYGKAYNDYKKSRKYYTETKSDADRKEMEEHRDEHLNDTMTTLREMWKDADPEAKKKMRQNLNTLVSEMQV